MSGAASPDLSGCEHEPVHIPGAVQPHGALLVLDPVTLEIHGLSESSEDLLALSPRETLGRALGTVASIENRAEIARELSQPDGDRTFFKLRLAGRTLDAVAHRHAGRLLLECEPENTDPAFAQAYFHERVLGSLTRLRKSSSLPDLCAQAAHEVRRVTGFDRVLIYAFKEDWSGEVLAEASAPGREAYLGLRFPASDIPRQARALYTSCRMRMVPTATYTPAPILGLPGAHPVDLTHAVLRSISPVHLEYMRNMGVTASMGLSLMRDDKLWGLITCNHESGERFVPHHARAACALIGEVVSSLIGPNERLQATEQRAFFQENQARLLERVAQERDVTLGLTRDPRPLLEVTRSAGAAFSYGDDLRCVGESPEPAVVAGLVDWLAREHPDGLVTESLPSVYAPARAWRRVGCGLVAAPISFARSDVVRKRSWLLWFRPEVAQTVSWGGDPNKPAAAPSGSERLHPRTSFRLWKEEVHLRSVPFLTPEVAAARALARALTDVVVEIEASRKIRADAIVIERANQRLIEQIEETRRVEVELRRVQKHEAIGRLAAGIAHEINTPLQFVTTNVEFVREATATLASLVARLGALTPEAREAAVAADFEFLQQELPKAVDQSCEGLERVASIVRTMKAFAGPDSADKSPGDINDAVRTTVAVARGEVDAVAEVTLALGELPRVSCYIADVRQVLLDLITNGARAIESAARSRDAAGGGVKQARGVISIRSWHARESVFVSITDDGAGIPEAIRESVFLPFFTTGDVGTGTGAGLAICHAIVVGKHGGSLSFESEVGQGTTFTMRLPAREATPSS